MFPDFWIYILVPTMMEKLRKKGIKPQTHWTSSASCATTCLTEFGWKTRTLKKFMQPIISFVESVRESARQLQASRATPSFIFEIMILCARSVQRPSNTGIGFRPTCARTQKFQNWLAICAIWKPNLRTIFFVIWNLFTWSWGSSNAITALVMSTQRKKLWSLTNIDTTMFQVI